MVAAGAAYIANGASQSDRRSRPSARELFLLVQSRPSDILQRSRLFEEGATLQIAFRVTDTAYRGKLPVKPQTDRVYAKSAKWYQSAYRSQRDGFYGFD